MRFLAVSLGVSVAGLSTHSAHADVTWNSAAATTDWNTTGNWSATPNGQNVQINNITGTIAKITANQTITPVDILVGVAASGRLDHTAGTAATGNGNWMVVGRTSGSSIYNLADTSGTGGTLTGFAQGSGSMNVGGTSTTIGRLVVGDGGTSSGTVNMYTSGTLKMEQDDIGILLGNGGTSVGNFNLDGGTVQVNALAANIGILIGTNGGDGNFRMSGGTVNETGGLWVGDANVGSQGLLEISGGSFGVTAGNSYIGRNLGQGTVTVSGTGSLSFSAVTHVGYSATTTAGTTGTVNVNGGTFTNTGEVRVGSSDTNGAFVGTGTFTVAGGSATVGSLTAARGNNNVAKVNGIVNVSSGTLTSTGGVIMGFAGAANTGTLNVSGTGTFNVGTTTATQLSVSVFDTSSGQINVSGGNLKLNTNSSIKFTTGNTGTVSTNAFTHSGGNVTFYSDNATTAGGTGVLDLQLSGAAGVSNTYHLNGGTLTANQILTTLNTGTAVFNFNGGTLTAATTGVDLLALGGANQRANVRNNGAVIDTNGKSVTISEALVHSNVGGDLATDGGLQKLNTGTLTLSGSSTYTGSTQIKDGTIALAGGNDRLLTTGSVVLGDGVANTSGKLQLSDGTTARNQTLGGLTAVGTGTANRVVGGGTGNSTLTLNIASGTNTFSGILGGAGTNENNLTLTKTGTGALILTGTNTYAGSNTNINGGILQAGSTQALGGDGTLGSVPTITFGGGTLQFSAANTTDYSSRFSQGASQAYSIDTNGQTVIWNTGRTPSSGGTLTKLGPGTLSMTTSANGWTGPTTITGGALSAGSLTNIGTNSSIGKGDSTSGATNAASLVFDGGTLQYTGATVVTDRAFTINASKTATIDTANDLTFAGATGTTTNGALTKTGAGMLTLTGANTYTGATTISNGTLQIGNGSTTGSLASGTAITNNGALIVNRSDALTMSNTISGTGSLAKSGAGTLTLTGANNYSGATNINAGTLAFSTSTQSLGSSAFTVADGTGLSVKAASAGSTLLTTASLTLGSAGSTNLTFDFNALNPTVTQISTGALTLNGTINLTLAATSGLGTNTYTLIDYTGTLGGSFSNLTPNSFTFGHSSASLVNNTGNTSVDLNVVADSLAWSGTGAQTWATATTGDNTGPNDWATKNAHAVTNFWANDAVEFNETYNIGAGDVTVANRAVTITGADVSPSGVIFNNTTGNYIITGSFGIAGNGLLIKNGAGAATLNTANTYSGGTTLNAGTLNLNNTSGIGTGILTISSGTLDNTSGSAKTLSTNNAQAWNGNFTFGGTNDLNLGTGTVTLGGNRTVTTNGSASLTVGGVIGGAFSLTKDGAGIMVLGGANTYTGGTTINAGTVQLGNATALGVVTNAVLAFGAGSTGKLQLNGNSITLTDLNTNATVGTPIIESGSGTAGTDTLTLDTANIDTYAGVLQNGSTRLLALTKSGAGSLTLSGANTHTGATSSSAGTLSLSGSLTGSNVSTSGTGIVSETSGGVIAGSGVTFTQGSSGTSVLAGVNTYTGATTIDAGTLTVSGGSAIADTGAVVLANTAGATFDLANSETIGSLAGGGATGGNVTLNANNLTVGDANNTAYAGIISGTGALNKTGAGTLTLGTSTNTFSGGLFINAGTIAVDSNVRLGGAGGTAGAITLNGGTLKTTAGITNTHPVTVGAGGGTINVISTGQYFFNVANTLLGSGTLTVIGSSGTLAGQSAGAGNLRVGATNTYNGNIITQSGGIFEYGVANAVASGVSGATFSIGNEGEVAAQNGVSLPNAITITGGTNSVLSFQNGNGGIFSGAITLNANATIGLRDWYNYGTVRSGSISGAMTGAGGIIVNSGTGTGGVLTLSNATSDYAGATVINSSVVNVGTFANVNTASSIGKGSVGGSAADLVLSGGTLRYTGATTQSTDRLFSVGTSGGTLDASGSNNANPLSFTGTGALGFNGQTGARTLTLTGTNTGANTLALIIGDNTGATSLTKAGAGTWTLSGANTYTGQTSLNAGTLVLANPGALGGTSTLNFGANTGTTLNIATDGGDTAFATNTSSGFSTTIVSNRATAGAGINHALGAAQYGGGTVNFTSGANVTSGTGAISYSSVSLTAGSIQTTTFNPTSATVSIGTVTIGSNNFVKTLGLDGTTAGNQVTGAITNGAGTVALLKNGVGTWTLSGTNTYTGATTVSVGTLNVAGTNSGNSAYTVNGTGILGVTGTLTTTGLMIVGDLANSGTLNVSDGTTTVGGLQISRSTAANNTATGTVNVTGGTLTSTEDVVVGLGGTQTGTMVIDGGTVNVGTGVLKWMKIGAFDTVSGQLTINSGNLNLNTNSDIRFSADGTTGTNVVNQNGGNVSSYSGNATGTAGSATDGLVDLQRGGAAATNNTYNLNGGTLTVNQVMSTVTTGTRTFNFNGGTLKAASGLATTFFDLGTGNARANVRNGGALIDTNGFNVTVAQALVHSNVGGDNATDGGLTKSGAGSLRLASSNTYTGPTQVTGGTLEISGSINATSSVSITSGTLLLSGGSDKVANVATSLGNGTLAFADGGTGGFTETLGTLTLSGTSTLDFGSGTTNGDSLIFAGLHPDTVSALNSGSIFLNIWNWSFGASGAVDTDSTNSGAEQDRLLFTATTGLDSVGLGRVSFYAGEGSGFLGTGSQITFTDGGFEVVPIPEPSTTGLIGAAALVGVIGYRERRRFSGLRDQWANRQTSVS